MIEKRLESIVTGADIIGNWGDLYDAFDNLKSNPDTDSIVNITLGAETMLVNSGGNIQNDAGKINYSLNLSFKLIL